MKKQRRYGILTLYKTKEGLVYELERRVPVPE